MRLTAKQQAALYYARRQRIARQGGAPPVIPPQAETDALVARMTVAPSAARKTLIDNVIVALKNAGIWTDLDLLYVFAAHDAQAAILNWKAATFPIVSMLVPVFTVDRGYDFDGTTQYLRTTFIPSTNGVNYTINSASAFIWCRDNVAGGSGVISLGAQGAASARSLKINPRHTANQFFIALNSDTTAQIGAVTDSIGLTHIERSSSANVTVYKNGVNSVTSALVSTGTPQVEIDLGALNANGTITGFDSRALAVMGLGKALGDTKATALYNALSTYLSAIGAA